MKIAEVINPEILLDLRGRKDIRALYRQLMNAIVMPTGTEGISYQVGNDPSGIFIRTYLSDPHALVYALLGKHFIMSKDRKCYYLPFDFGTELAGIDRDIPVSMLPKSFTGYIHFAKGMLHDEEDEIAGCYVYIGPANKVAIQVDDPNEPCFAAAYWPRTPDGSVDAVTKMVVSLKNLNDQGSIDFFDILPTGKRAEIDSKVQAIRDNVSRTILNTVLYINSQDPELFHLSSKYVVNTKKHHEDLAKTGYSNLCSIPLTLVNHSYLRPKEHHIDETWVRTHPRWQRCGPENSQVKLIWVEGHTRKFKNEA